MQNKREWPALLGFLVLTLGMGALGAVVTAQNVPAWYASLGKPPGTPPSWLFGPVWTTLYVLIAVSAWMVYVRRGASGRGIATALFWLQFMLNAIWTPIFFGLHQLGAGLAVIVALDLAVLAWIWASGRVSRVAAALLAPYFAWILYATYLNYGLWSLAGR